MNRAILQRSQSLVQKAPAGPFQTEALGQKDVQAMTSMTSPGRNA